MLRGRRGLSLDDVASLSRTFADPIQKSYLSRCENGRHSLALSKLIPLSRIYEVPAEVILERLELDMELDKVGGPDTKGLSYETLSNRGKKASDQGALWQAYAYFRDSAVVASTSALMGRLRDHSEQLLCAHMNFSSAAAKLGRLRVSVHELEFIRDSKGLSSRLVPILFERLANTRLALNQLDLARLDADRAIEEGQRIGLADYLGYLYSTRARVATIEKDHRVASDLHRRAFDYFKAAGLEAECALTLANLSQTYFDQGRVSAARRSLSSAERIAIRCGQDRTRAMIRIMLGEIEELESRSGDAAAHWRDAVEIARRLNDKTLRFRAEFLLFRQARRLGDDTVARVIERRLHRLVPWIRGKVDEVDDFRRISTVKRKPLRKTVAGMQHRG